MIARNYRLKLIGRDTRTTYIERYYADYESANNDLLDISEDYKEITKDYPDKSYNIQIDERMESYSNSSYEIARLETLMKE